jgi:hypothetical protein
MRRKGGLVKERRREGEKEEIREIIDCEGEKGRRRRRGGEGEEERRREGEKKRGRQGDKRDNRM